MFTMPIPGYNYKATECGQIVSPRGRILTPYKKSKHGGHLAVKLYKNGQRKSFQVGRLVLMAFTQENKPKHDAHHIDENPLNNAANNLKWLSAKIHRSGKWRKRCFTGEYKPTAKQAGDPF